jgi:hypothetical protein
MASARAALPDRALKALQKGIPADKVLTPGLSLTPQEKQFVQAIAEGASKRDAYIEAYEPQGSSRSTTTAAWRVAERSDVKQAIAVQEGIQRLRYSQNPLRIRDFLVDELQHIARTAKKDSDRLGALRMLGQLADVSAFETRSVVTHQSASDTTAKLREKLARLGGVIDVEAHDPTQGEGAQSGGAGRGDSRSNNPHVPSDKYSNPHVPTEKNLDPPDEDPHPLLKSTIPPMGGITSEEAPMEDGVGSHTGGRKKKERPIWEDPKRWYAETMGEVPKIEWQPREEARDEVQKRLNDGLE